MEKLSLLGINLPLFIAQLVNFLILLGLLYQFGYKRVLKTFDERTRRIKESIDQTEQIKQQAARAEEEFKKRIEASSKEGQELINRAARTGQELQAQAQEDAKKEAEAIAVRARSDIQRERDGAIEELRKSFADLTVLAAGRVIERSLDKEAHRQLIEKTLEESTGFKKN